MKLIILSFAALLSWLITLPVALLFILVVLVILAFTGAGDGPDTLPGGALFNPEKHYYFWRDLYEGVCAKVKAFIDAESERN